MPTVATVIPTTTIRRRSRQAARLALGAVGAMALTVLAGFTYQALATDRDASAFPPPGRLVDVGGYRLHLFCIGSGSPTVILEAAFPAQVSNWIWIQPELAAHTRVCAYDRAGLGWSDPGPAPRDATQHSRELQTLLTNAAVSGPYVLVGHSLGGLYVRQYATDHPTDVAGLVLIEASHPDAWARLGERESVGADPGMLAVAPGLARLGFFRLRLFPVPPADPDLPPQQRAEEQAFFDSSKYFDTLLATDQAFPAALEQVRQTGDLGSLPLTVVIGSASENASGPRRDLQNDLARLSTLGILRVIEGATHASLVDRQADARQTGALILELVDAVRAAEALNP